MMYEIAVNELRETQWGIQIDSKRHSEVYKQAVKLNRGLAKDTQHTLSRVQIQRSSQEDHVNT